MSYQPLAEVQREIFVAQSKKQALVEERARLFADMRAGNDSPGLEQRIQNLDRGIGRLDEVIKAGVAELARSERHIENGTPEWERESDRVEPQARRNPERDAALRTIERHAGLLASPAADALDELVTDRDPNGLAARYLTAVGDPAYFRAFGKMLADPATGQLRFTPSEVEAVRRVAAVQAERSMVEGVDSQGGFAVPFELDPSILLTSDGALNPIRQLARVIQVTSSKWKGVSSEGVTASYDAEAAEVSDDSPTLAQPEIDVAMGRAFIPFSIELGMDWQGASQELAQLISDGRDLLDAQKLLDGSGTNEPEGVLTGLTASEEVQTAASGTFALGDVYALRQALPARFVPSAAFAAHPDVLDIVYRFVGTGDPTEPPLMPSRDGGILGKKTAEWSTMAATVSAGNKILLYGDFAQGYRIADRLGMTVELIQHLFGANRRPTGERGLFAYWRTGAAVVVPNAIRVLKVKA